MTISRLAFAALLVFTGAAFADDACLTGASRLGDQRAIAMLRESTETACPCASFAGQGRSAFQRCARGALDAALDAAELRAACAKTAKKINKGATCGSSRVACGQFQATAADPVSCRVKAPARCSDTPRAERNPCSNETHCADVVEWTAGTCVDPREDGPFAIGTTVVTFTKPSYIDPETDRVLETAIWYPAPPGSGPFDPVYGGVLDAPLDLSGGPYPLIMFSHGSCGYQWQSKFLTPMLASYGFIVAAPPHPGNTLYEFPSCGTPGAQAASAAERPQDIIYVTDQMLAADADSGSFFFGAIDETRLGMSGHSFGGFTTYRVLLMDSRFDVAMPLAPAVPGTPVLTVPSLHMLGQVDSVVSVPAIRTAYEDAQPPKFLVEVRDAGHFAFSDACFPSPDCNPPTTLTQDEAHAVVRRWVLPFMKVYLAGDTSYAPMLAGATSTTVDFQAEP